MIELSTSLNHYKRPEIQQAIVEHAANKEIAVRFSDNFGKRPNIFQYPSEVLGFAKQKATSFHVSEEIWSNPLDVETGMTRNQLDELRTGWDLVLDVDCKFIEYSKIAADKIVKLLKYKNAGNVSLKFSGNNGFHVGLAYESFPEKIHGKETRLLFPEAAKRIALYIRQEIKNHVAEEILEIEGGRYNNVAEKTGVAPEKLYDKKNDNLDPELILSIDTVLLSSRHLYRMPYSLHEKSGLVSVPLDPGKVLNFSKKMAEPEIIEVGKTKFLDRTKPEPGEAVKLFESAYDATATLTEEPVKKQERKYESLSEAIPESLFPDCIKKLLLGIDSDGRKRALFVLANFLSNCGWSYEMIEKRLEEWNQNNREPLKEANVRGQLKYVKGRKSFLPPNCNNESYYKDLQVKCSEEICSKVRNPVVFARRRLNFQEGRKKVKKKSS